MFTVNGGVPADANFTPVAYALLALSFIAFLVTYGDILFTWVERNAPGIVAAALWPVRWVYALLADRDARRRRRVGVSTQVFLAQRRAMDAIYDINDDDF